MLSHRGMWWNDGRLVFQTKQFYNVLMFFYMVGWICFLRVRSPQDCKPGLSELEDSDRRAEMQQGQIWINKLTSWIHQWNANDANVNTTTYIVYISHTVESRGHSMTTPFQVSRQQQGTSFRSTGVGSTRFHITWTIWTLSRMWNLGW